MGQQRVGSTKIILSFSLPYYSIICFTRCSTHLKASNIITLTIQSLPMTPSRCWSLNYVLVTKIHAANQSRMSERGK